MSLPSRLPSHFSSPVSVPKGAKATYLADSEPEKTAAKTGRDSDQLSHPTSPSVQLPIVVDIIRVPQCPAGAGDVYSVLDILSTHPVFVDIRKRYLWYVTDGKKNYYKESAYASKTGSNISISNTPQFRRNSQ